jgi:hypothetical protein
MNTVTALPRPTAIVAVVDYTLRITFNNGETRLFNATPYLAYPAFAPLKAVSLFMQARVAHNTVVWNEEIDIAPENLYLESTLV